MYEPPRGEVRARINGHEAARTIALPQFEVEPWLWWLASPCLLLLRAFCRYRSITSRGITIAIGRSPSSSQPIELAIGTAAEAVALVAVVVVLAATGCAGADLYAGCVPNQ